MPKYTCEFCGKISWTPNDYRGFCKKCSDNGAALASLRVRTVAPENDLIKVPGETGTRGIAHSQGIPDIWVVEFSGNRQIDKKSNNNIVLWCADPDKLRLFFIAAKEMVSAAVKGFNNDDKGKTTWFGVETDTLKWSAIGTKIIELDNYFKNTIGMIKFACTYENGIAAIDPKKFNSTSATVTVLLDKGFCWRRYSDGEIICSIVHEFTHIICGTTDERLASKDQYGLTKCQALATDHPDQAWKNADNWAYYICEYRNQTTNSPTIDWNYLDANSYSQRTPLSEGMGPP